MFRVDVMSSPIGFSDSSIGRGRPILAFLSKRPSTLKGKDLNV